MKIRKDGIPGAGGIALAVLVGAVLTSGGSAYAETPTVARCLLASESGLKLNYDHKLKAARAELLVCADPACPVQVRTECVRLVEEVTKALPSIVFEAKDGSGADLGAVKVTMDGRPFAEKLDGTSVALDPGAHSFTFETAGQAALQKTFILQQGVKDRHERVVLGAAKPQGVVAAKTSAPAPTAQLDTSQDSHRLGAQKIAGIAVGGAGIVGLALGTAFGLVSMLKHSAASTACPNAYCTSQDGTDKWNSAMSAGNTSTVAFIIGGIATAGGAVLFLTATPPTETGTTPQVGFGLGTIQLKGNF